MPPRTFDNPNLWPTAAHYHYAGTVEPVVIIGMIRGQPLAAFADGSIRAVPREHVRVVAWSPAIEAAFAAARTAG